MAERPGIYCYFIPSLLLASILILICSYVQAKNKNDIAKVVFDGKGHCVTDQSRLVSVGSVPCLEFWYTLTIFNDQCVGSTLLA